MESHLLQMRGLKRVWGRIGRSESVASFTDAWIETNDKDSLEDKERSHLLQMRGLKQVLGSTYKLVRGRIFYRCVD